MYDPVRTVLAPLVLTICAGCSPLMVSVMDTDATHPVDSELTKEQVKTAILNGAQAAGWYAKDIGDDTILASFQLRTHAVQVEIDYTDTDYVTRYKTSAGMKMFCTEIDKSNHQNMKISGQENCPGGAPLYIHKSYKGWIDSLNRSIAVALSPAYVGAAAPVNPGTMSPSVKAHLCELAKRDAARSAEEAAAMDAARTECRSKLRGGTTTSNCSYQPFSWKVVHCEDQVTPAPDCPAGSGKDTAERRIQKFCN